MSNIDNLSVNAIRVLSADAVQKANSGHPGLPLGAAAIGYELWANHMNHNPKNPSWENRDRFVLSGGHGSTLLYSLLHLFGYGLTLDDLKNFRQWGSKTPGHPEYGVTTGVEASTGPLGAGMAMAVGMAMAETHLAAKFNKEGYPVVDHYTYVLGGDGCMMEGINYEAFSLAGTLKLNKLIVLYDSNKISIEGNTDIAFTEDVPARFKAMGFKVLEVKDGNDISEIGKAIEEAKEDKESPSFIKINTKIGFGSPKEGSADVHGAPLGADNIIAMKKTLGWPSEEPFFVPDEVYENYKAKAENLAKKEEEWSKLFKDYCEKFPEMKTLWDEYKDETKACKLLDDEDFWSYEEKADATRNLSGKVLNKLSAKLPTLFGGSADLAPSNKSYVNGAGDYSAENYAGRNVHFGVRELAMTGIGNGLVLHGLKAYVSTFFVFSDYVKPMARLASLMEIPLTFILTHDSIGVGEDGPTHEPIEQLAEFRAMPNFNVFRPADATETIAAWYSAVTSKETPTALVLTRQNLPQLAGSSKEALKGGYIVADSSKETPDAIIIASGSEVSLSIEAKEALAKEGIDVRVVSMPCMDIFEKQPLEYKEKVLPKSVRARVAVEALSEFGWGKYVGLDGKTVCLDRFGASAPADVLFKEFGFTVDNVVKAVKEVIK
ncbi:transketolase [Catonella massiliensis]|jgi:transketolase|uniref:Transketolase n=1 Tax=Catonella massiliensis TaxID=2799636 RepID=A0ABS1IWJ1_9FIRM|nr:transketolase [Catonella massiliensis]MBK5896257.1 transketolase [Catonella massiliensis]